MSNPEHWLRIDGDHRVYDAPTAVGPWTERRELQGVLTIGARKFTLTAANGRLMLAESGWREMSCIVPYGGWTARVIQRGDDVVAEVSIDGGVSWSAVLAMPVVPPR